MKLKILFVIAGIISGSIAFAQDTTGSTRPQVIIPLGKKSNTPTGATTAPLLPPDTNAGIAPLSPAPVKIKRKNATRPKKTKSR